MAFPMVPWRAGLELAPWRRMRDIDEWFDRMWRETWPRAMREEVGPALEMIEKKDQFLVRLEVPGLEERDLAVSCEDHVLTVRGEKKSEEESVERGSYYSERSYGAFERTITLPSSADVEKVRAECKNGVLSIHVPKKETARAKQIPITVERAVLTERKQGK